MACFSHTVICIVLTYYLFSLNSSIPVWNNNVKEVPGGKKQFFFVCFFFYKGVRKIRT